MKENRKFQQINIVCYTVIHFNAVLANELILLSAPLQTLYKLTYSVISCRYATVQGDLSDLESWIKQSNMNQN